MVDRFPNSEMAEELNKLAIGKEIWLAEFSSGKRQRPAHEIEHKRHELSILRQATSDYRRSSERDRGAA